MLRGACIGCNPIVILHRGSLAKALFLGIAGCLTTLGAIPAQACEGAAYRAFDFWLGHWQVRLADGRLAGENRIEASRDGCYLTERWQGARGSEGFSLNFYQPADGRWRQVWVSADTQIEITGGLADGRMVLNGEIRYRRPLDTDRAGADGPGPVRPFRGSWTPLPDGRVRQFFEERVVDADGVEKWQPWFEGFYTKVVE
jgi:hypothetical protein